MTVLPGVVAVLIEPEANVLFKVPDQVKRMGEKLYQDPVEVRKVKVFDSGLPWFRKGDTVGLRMDAPGLEVTGLDYPWVPEGCTVKFMNVGKIENIEERDLFLYKIK